MPAIKGKPDSSERGSGLPGKHGRVGTRHIAPGSLRDQFRAARDRLDESVTLLERALDVLELFSWGVELDDARRLVAELRRDVRAMLGRRRRP